MSACTFKAVRDYFRDGILPKEGTVCEIESTVFNGLKNSLASRDLDEPKIADAWSGFSKGFKFKSPMMRKGL